MSCVDNFNMIVTFKEIDGIFSTEVLGIEELEYALQKCNFVFYIKESAYYDVITVEICDDPLKAVNELSNFPCKFIENVVPVDCVVNTSMENIIESTVLCAINKVKDGESFDLKCKTRGKKDICSQKELEVQISEKITNIIQVEPAGNKPDWMIMVEVVGEKTGISVNKPENMIIR